MNYTPTEILFVLVLVLAFLAPFIKKHRGKKEYYETTKQAYKDALHEYEQEKEGE